MIDASLETKYRVATGSGLPSPNYRHNAAEPKSGWFNSVKDPMLNPLAWGNHNSQISQCYHLKLIILQVLHILFELCGFGIDPRML